jgi:hypothetical protein
MICATVPVNISRPLWKSQCYRYTMSFHALLWQAYKYRFVTQYPSTQVQLIIALAVLWCMAQPLLAAALMMLISPPVACTITLLLSRSDMTAVVPQLVIRKARARAKIRIVSSDGETPSLGILP